MKLIDSNIIIYTADPNYGYLQPLVTDKSNFSSAITKVEVLGFSNLLPAEKTYFESIFRVLNILKVDDRVVDKAIEIRQKHKIKLGDLLIAATAVVYNLELYTRNVTDFQKIEGLTIVNPII